MTDQRSRRRGVVDIFLDLTFFAPLGFWTSVRDVVPDLADRGRNLIDEQLGNARVVGRFAVQRGSQEVTKAAGRLTTAPAAATARAPRAEAVIDTDGAPIDTAPVEEHIPIRLEDVADEGLDTVTWESVGEDELAIPSYDSLAASQVVARLDGLTDEELEAVRRYEIAHRGRKTILGKVAQLQKR